jgi:hypothetical protein
MLPCGQYENVATERKKTLTALIITACVLDWADAPVMIKQKSRHWRLKSWFHLMKTAY